MVQQVRLEQLELLQNPLIAPPNSQEVLPTRQQLEMSSVIAALDTIARTQKADFATVTAIVVNSEQDGTYLVTIVRPDQIIASAATRESAEKAVELARTAIAKCTESGGTAQIVEANGYVHEGVAIALAPTADDRRDSQVRDRS